MLDTVESAPNADVETTSQATRSCQLGEGMEQPLSMVAGGSERSDQCEGSNQRTRGDS